MPLNIDWQQILLHLLNFVILFAGLWLLLYKPVRSFMQKRKEHYEQMDADAEKKRTEADAARSEYEQKLAAADDEIAQRRHEAEHDAAEYEERRRRETDELAASILDAARADAARIREQAKKDARSDIAAIVTEAVKKATLNNTSEAYDAFLNAADAQTEQKDE